MTVALPVEEHDLLDPAGVPVGSMAKAHVHGLDTPLHLAFSCYGFGRDGRMLLTRRSLGKRTWPGVWTNSCCGHPRPGESPAAAARRRVTEELGVVPHDLRPVLPDFAYEATMPDGTRENEACPVFAARAHGDPVPDPAEVAEWRWVPWPEVVAVARTSPWLISPWAALQVGELAELFGDERIPA